MKQTPQRRISPDAVAAFQKTIYDYYRAHGRKLPWRETRDPYHILVSEIMLQQTQVDRVRGKYEQFITAFPDLASLDRAPLHAVLKVWQGLGYNRRALALKKSAEIVMAMFNGELPSSPDLLITLPGVGKSTASAVAAFAFQKPAVFIETNIRTVYIHFFFPEKDAVRDSEILPLVEQTLDTRNPREWHYALMDYGVMLKKRHRNPGRKSAHHKKQPPFEGSNRQIRGMILRALVEKPNLSERQLLKILGTDAKRMLNSLSSLEHEGLITRQGKRFAIASG